MMTISMVTIAMVRTITIGSIEGISRGLSISRSFPISMCISMVSIRVSIVSIVGISMMTISMVTITMVRAITIGTIEGISRSFSISRSLAIMESMGGIRISIVSMVGISMMSITIGTIEGISFSFWFGISISSNSCK